MNKSLALALSFLCLTAAPAKACECLQFPDINAMMVTADFAYAGEWVAPDYAPDDPAEAPVSFKVTNNIIGKDEMLGHTIALDRKKDVEPACRAFKTGVPRGKFLFFGSMYENKKQTFLTDCGTDMVLVGEDGKLTMRGKPVSVTLFSLQQQPRKKRAFELTEEQAIVAATQFAREEKKYEKEKFGVLNTKYKDVGGMKPYWVVRFAEFPPVNDGKTFEVTVYSSDNADMSLKDTGGEE